MRTRRGCSSVSSSRADAVVHAVAQLTAAGAARLFRRRRRRAAERRRGNALLDASRAWRSVTEASADRGPRWATARVGRDALKRCAAAAGAHADLAAGARGAAAGDGFARACGERRREEEQEGAQGRSHRGSVPVGRSHNDVRRRDHHPRRRTVPSGVVSTTRPLPPFQMALSGSLPR